MRKVISEPARNCQGGMTHVHNSRVFPYVDMEIRP
jgi:hypothetical protein